MKQPWLQRILPQTLAFTAVLTFAGAALPAQDAGQPQQNAAAAAGQRTDGQIEMDVVKALDDSQALKNDLITAATIQGQVTLSGTVSSDASKQLAESIVEQSARRDQGEQSPEGRQSGPGPERPGRAPGTGPQRRRRSADRR